MIELTEQQENLLMPADSFTGSEPVLDLEDIQDFLALLTIEQLKPLVGSCDSSVVEWVEFDFTNVSTYPNNDNYVLTYFHVDGVINTVCIQRFDTTNGCFIDVSGSDFVMAVTHWAYLPTPKEK